MFRGQYDCNIISDKLLRSFPSLTFEIIKHSYNKHICYRAVLFHLHNNIKMYAESFLRVDSKKSYSISRELKFYNGPLGCFLLNRWSEDQLKFTPLSIEKISGKDVPKIFHAERTKQFLFRKRIITADEHNFLIHEYFPVEFE